VKFRLCPLPLQFGGSPGSEYLHQINGVRVAFHGLVIQERDVPDDMARAIKAFFDDQHTRDAIAHLLGQVKVTDVAAPLDNAHGFRQTLFTTDAFFDTHLALTRSPRAQVVAGVDHLHGDGVADGGDFDYTVRPDGNNAPAGGSLASQSAVHISDRRDFSGLYAQIGLNPGDRWHFDIGARLNRTSESRLTRSIDVAMAESVCFATGPWQSGQCWVPSFEKSRRRKW